MIGYELPRSVAQLEQRDWAAHVGEYEVHQGYHVRVVHDDDLVLQSPGQLALALLPISKTVFYAEAVDLEVTFRQDEAGRTSGLLLHQNGINIDVEARRVD
jgi:hypothetical protein